MVEIFSEVYIPLPPLEQHCAGVCKLLLEDFNPYVTFNSLIKFCVCESKHGTKPEFYDASIIIKD